jgi:hypothetical protein
MKRSVELKDLKPATSYNFTVVIMGTKDSIRSSCWRYITTLGEANLLANPSFEELGGPLVPQMDYDKWEFASYWEPLMMPYSVKQLPKGGRAWFTQSNDQPNKRAANQWVRGMGAGRPRCQVCLLVYPHYLLFQVLVNGTKPTKMLLSAWSKASGVNGDPDDGYSVYMDLKFQDGTYAYGSPC